MREKKASEVFKNNHDLSSYRRKHPPLHFTKLYDWFILYRKKDHSFIIESKIGSNYFRTAPIKTIFNHSMFISQMNKTYQIVGNMSKEIASRKDAPSDGYLPVRLNYESRRKFNVKRFITGWETFLVPDLYEREKDQSDETETLAKQKQNFDQIMDQIDSEGEILTLNERYMNKLPLKSNEGASMVEEAKTILFNDYFNKLRDKDRQNVLLSGETTTSTPKKIISTKREENKTIRSDQSQERSINEKRNSSLQKELTMGKKNVKKSSLNQKNPAFTDSSVTSKTQSSQKKKINSNKVNKAGKNNKRETSHFKIETRSPITGKSNILSNKIEIENVELKQRSTTKNTQVIGSDGLETENTQSIQSSTIQDSREICKEELKTKNSKSNKKSSIKDNEEHRGDKLETINTNSNEGSTIKDSREICVEKTEIKNANSNKSSKDTQEINSDKLETINTESKERFTSQNSQDIHADKTEIKNVNSKKSSTIKDTQEINKNRIQTRNAKSKVKSTAEGSQEIGINEAQTKKSQSYKRSPTKDLQKNTDYRTKNEQTGRKKGNSSEIESTSPDDSMNEAQKIQDQGDSPIKESSKIQPHMDTQVIQEKKVSSFSESANSGVTIIPNEQSPSSSEKSKSANMDKKVQGIQKKEISCSSESLNNNFTITPNDQPLEDGKKSKSFRKEPMMEHQENINEKDTESFGINDDFNTKEDEKIGNIVKNDGYEMETTQAPKKEQIIQMKNGPHDIKTGQAKKNLDVHSDGHSDEQYAPSKKERKKHSSKVKESPQSINNGSVKNRPKKESENVQRLSENKRNRKRKEGPGSKSKGSCISNRPILKKENLISQQEDTPVSKEDVSAQIKKISKFLSRANPKHFTFQNMNFPIFKISHNHKEIKKSNPNTTRNLTFFSERTSLPQQNQGNKNEIHLGIQPDAQQNDTKQHTPFKTTFSGIPRPKTVPIAGENYEQTNIPVNHQNNNSDMQKKGKEADTTTYNQPNMDCIEQFDPQGFKAIKTQNNSNFEQKSENQDPTDIFSPLCRKRDGKVTIHKNKSSEIGQEDGAIHVSHDGLLVKVADKRQIIQDLAISESTSPEQIDSNLTESDCTTNSPYDQQSSSLTKITNEEKENKGVIEILSENNAQKTQPLDIINEKTKNLGSNSLSERSSEADIIHNQQTIAHSRSKRNRKFQKQDVNSTSDDLIKTKMDVAISGVEPQHVVDQNLNAVLSSKANIMACCDSKNPSQAISNIFSEKYLRNYMTEGSSEIQSDNNIPPKHSSTLSKSKIEIDSDSSRSTMDPFKFLDSKCVEPNKTRKIPELANYTTPLSKQRKKKKLKSINTSAKCVVNGISSNKNSSHHSYKKSSSKKFANSVPGNRHIVEESSLLSNHAQYPVDTVLSSNDYSSYEHEKKEKGKVSTSTKKDQKSKHASIKNALSNYSLTKLNNSPLNSPSANENPFSESESILDEKSGNFDFSEESTAKKNGNNSSPTFDNTFTECHLYDQHNRPSPKFSKKTSTRANQEVSRINNANTNQMSGNGEFSGDNPVKHHKNRTRAPGIKQFKEGSGNHTIKGSKRIKESISSMQQPEKNDTFLIISGHNEKNEPTQNLTTSYSIVGQKSTDENVQNEHSVSFVIDKIQNKSCDDSTSRSYEMTSTENKKRDRYEISNKKDLQRKSLPGEPNASHEILPSLSNTEYMCSWASDASNPSIFSDSSVQSSMRRHSQQNTKTRQKDSSKEEISQSLDGTKRRRSVKRKRRICMPMPEKRSSFQSN